MPDAFRVSVVANCAYAVLPLAMRVVKVSGGGLRRVIFREIDGRKQRAVRKRDAGRRRAAPGSVSTGAGRA